MVAFPWRFFKVIFKFYSLVLLISDTCQFLWSGFCAANTVRTNVYLDQTMHIGEAVVAEVRRVYGKQNRNPMIRRLELEFSTSRACSKTVPVTFLLRVFTPDLKLQTNLCLIFYMSMFRYVSWALHTYFDVLQGWEYFRRVTFNRLLIDFVHAFTSTWHKWRRQRPPKW